MNGEMDFFPLYNKCYPAFDAWGSHGIHSKCISIVSEERGGLIDTECYFSPLPYPVDFIQKLFHSNSNLIELIFNRC